VNSRLSNLTKWDFGPHRASQVYNNAPMIITFVSFTNTADMTFLGPLVPICRPSQNSIILTEISRKCAERHRDMLSDHFPSVMGSTMYYASLLDTALATVLGIVLLHPSWKPTVFVRTRCKRSTLCTESTIRCSLATNFYRTLWLVRQQAFTRL
jgi:hypothetical protein